MVYIDGVGSDQHDAVSGGSPGKELEMCPVNISLITDYDSGLVGDVDPVSHSEVVKVFTNNLAKLQTMLVKLLELVPAERKTCKCGEALLGARFT